jgi:hypothetical protein
MGDDWKRAKIEATVFGRLDDGRIAWMLDVQAPDGMRRAVIVDGVGGLVESLREYLERYDDPACIEPHGWEIRRDPDDVEPAFVVTPTASVDARDGIRIRLGGVLLVRGGRHDASALVDLAHRQGLDVRPILPPIEKAA